MKSFYIEIGLASVMTAGICPFAFATTASDIVAVGPVEVVETGSITVLGREYKLEDTSGLTTGEKVAIHGALQPDGSASNVHAESLGIYSPGSDTIFETGVVTKVDADSGHFSMAGADVDYTATLAASDSAAPAVGQLVSIEGVQPVAGGVILGSSTSVGISSMTIAMAGRAASVSGSGALNQSVSGSGALNQSVSGSGALNQSVSGSGALNQSVSGSGALNQSVSGSGALNQSVSGSGALNQSGSGSGALNQSVSGSGALNQSVSGSGALNQSVSGSGALNQSVSGSGALNQSVSGSG